MTEAPVCTEIKSEPTCYAAHTEVLQLGEQ